LLQDRILLGDVRWVEAILPMVSPERTVYEFPQELACALSPLIQNSAKTIKRVEKAVTKRCCSTWVTAVCRSRFLSGHLFMLSPVSIWPSSSEIATGKAEVCDGGSDDRSVRIVRATHINVVRLDCAAINSIADQPYDSNYDESKHCDIAMQNAGEHRSTYQ
jgi:hypothetical protein